MKETSKTVTAAGGSSSSSFSKWQTWFYCLWVFLKRVMQILYLSYREYYDEWDKDAYMVDFSRLLYLHCVYEHPGTRECFSRPVSGVPGDTIRLALYNSNREDPASYKEAINFGSYNYLGYAGENMVPSDAVVTRVSCTLSYKEWCGGGGATKSSAASAAPAAPAAVVEAPAFQDPIRLVEKTLCEFLGTQEAIVFPMGWGTNVSVLPVIANRKTLIVADEKNHASIAMGCKRSGARVKTFRFNSIESLETLLSREFALRDVYRQRQQQQKQQKQEPNLRYDYEEEEQQQQQHNFDSVWIVVEGVYSMEGNMCPLDRLMDVKQRYGPEVKLFLDEAHSIGATGPTGRGVTEHYRVDRSQVDILMGTFTKSFSSIGGYVASNNKQLMQRIRRLAANTRHDVCMSPLSALQIYGVLQDLMATRPLPLASSSSSSTSTTTTTTTTTSSSSSSSSSINDDDGPGEENGQTRVERLRQNTKYMRLRLRSNGFNVMGQEGSPVIPIITQDIDRMARISQYCYQRGLALVVAAYPATPLTESRVRLCVSASHTREQIEQAVVILGEAFDCC